MDFSFCAVYNLVSFSLFGGMQYRGGGGMGHAVIGKYTVVLADVIVLEPGYMTLLFVYFAWNAFNCDHTSGSWATSIDQTFC